jgi:ArsR family transcriptional regulator
LVLCRVGTGCRLERQAVIGGYFLAYDQSFLEGLSELLYFHIIGIMENKDAVNALAALAQESRLTIFRLLVSNAPEGLTPGVIGEQLALPAATLSFHLKTLSQAGLVTAVQEGRYVRYRAEMNGINGLISFLTEDCCGGDPQRCSPKGKSS